MFPKPSPSLLLLLLLLLLRNDDRVSSEILCAAYLFITAALALGFALVLVQHVVPRTHEFFGDDHLQKTNNHKNVRSVGQSWTVPTVFGDDNKRKRKRRTNLVEHALGDSQR